MLTDQELQSLRNLGNEAEAAADEIALLRARLNQQIDYTKLIEDCYSRTKQAQGTRGCVQFARGAEWWREQVQGA